MRNFWSGRLPAALGLWVFAAGGPPAALAQPDVKEELNVEGKWSGVFQTENVMIHASVLPNGKVLYWSRREPGEGLSPPPPRDCQPRVWDPAKGTGQAAFAKTANTPGFNLFCSGHSFLPDGRLFAAGGHIADGKGEPLATIYDPTTDKWSPVADKMSGGRWYPTAVTLPGGGILVSFGTDELGDYNNTQQVWKNGQWVPNQGYKFPNDVPPYYPRMHVLPNGRVLMSGPLPLTQILDVSGTKTWEYLQPGDRSDPAVIARSSRANGFRDYAPAVMYEPGKVLYAGGGRAPTKGAEVVDLTKPLPVWQGTGDMKFARRHHNATLLPDGTVLVTGGTQGNGGPGDDSGGFDDLRNGQPIRSAELWDPKTGSWTKLAKAAVNRCYHSTAILLPDATVLSAGGGEYSPKNDGNENRAQDTHPDAQIFSPPYLFRPDGKPADRPVITTPAEVGYGETFNVGTDHPDQIGRVTWVRLPSVTHSFDMNQRINVLDFTAHATGLKVTAPATANLCPEGHYMLFALTRDGVPSVAKVVRIR